MIKNYLKTALRQLWRNKFYSLLNILGLAIGLASSLLIMLYVKDELSYDQFHANKARIYRITEEFKTGEGVVETGLTPYKIGPDLKERFPAIKEVVRIDYDLEKYIVKYGDKKFIERSITSADPGFFRFFSFNLLEGNPTTVLNEPYTLAISEKQAKKYFPGQNAMGKILSFTDAYSHKNFSATVTGVFSSMPKNSHFHKDFILSKSTADILIPERINEYGWTSHFSYMLLAPGTNPDQLEKSINEHIFKTYPETITRWWSRFRLQSLTDIHLHSNLKEELEPNGDIAYVYIFAAIAFFLIILASINYMNLATARAATRAREVGVRKALGAMKKQLIYQFLGESILITMVALFIGLVLAKLSIPLFNSISGKELELDFPGFKGLAAVLGGTLLIGIISGSYPSFYLSAFQPVKVLKGTMGKAGQSSLLLRSGLVILQFSISIMLITGTIVIYKQWHFLQNKKLGINSEQVLIVNTETSKIQTQYPVLKQEILRLEGIVSVTGSRKNLTSRFGNYTSVNVEGQEKSKTIPWTFVDANFFNAFNVPLVKGEDFTESYQKDSLTHFILNESAAKLLGLTAPVGLNIEALGRKGKIKGIIKDFHFESLHAAISPTIFVPAVTDLNFIAIRMRSNDFKKTIESIEKVYEQIDAEAIFTYTFLDDDIANLYISEAKFFNVFISFSCLAIFIACLGIFGLASFTASQRSKEISIRKILGASVQNISFLLTKDFIKLVILANLIAWPVAYFFMYRWLQGFPYRIDQGLPIFLSAAAIALIIALLTVSFQAIRAAIANPVENLRTE
ncbi:MAG: ABC transporter permease [Ferruginibacter sp.]